MSDVSAESPVRAHILVSGRVQGVGYRAFAFRVASARRLLGGVRNLDDGRVELDVEGARSEIDVLVVELRAGPPTARVAKIEVEWGKATGRFSNFSVWY
jgi:acylphosphatase